MLVGYNDILHAPVSIKFGAIIQQKPQRVYLQMAAAAPPEDVSVERVRVAGRRAAVLAVEGLQARRPHETHSHPVRGPGDDQNYKRDLLR